MIKREHDKLDAIPQNNFATMKSNEADTSSPQQIHDSEDVMIHESHPTTDAPIPDLVPVDQHHDEMKDLVADTPQVTDQSKND